jgi:KDO2-lipid IV(A) lauroyltransferase
MPFRLFYLFSDLIFILTFYLIRYRRKVVQANLRLAFPLKEPAEINKIEKEFYRHMCNLFLEAIKTMKISSDEMKKRFKVLNIEVLTELEKERSIIVLTGHYANWEWSSVVNLMFKTRGYAIYQKIANPYFDAWIKRIRTKWNTTLIRQQEMVRTIVRNEADGVNALYLVVSDQSPQLHKANYWCKFMGITVPVYDSPEMLARKFGLAVVFAKISRLKRGYYQLEFVPIAKDGRATSEHEITDRFFELLEESIREAPPYYLWTHRRWKHRDKVPPEFQ